MATTTRYSSGSSASRTPKQGRFATTRWSLVLHAGRSGSTGADDALASLCRTYWFPLYAHVRRRGHRPHDAEDLTQAFFVRLLAQRTLERADPARGRFRSFILAVLDRFLADEWDKVRAQKRGGGQEVVSLNVEAAERRLELEAPEAGSPDQAFDRRWAGALLEHVLQQLETEYAAAGRAGLFDALKPTLIGARASQPYAALAAQLGSTEGALKVAVHRLRQRYRELLEAGIADTVATPEAAAEEKRHLIRALAGGLNV